MDETRYSLLIDRIAARRLFRGVGARNLVLAVLAGVPPLPEWEGCLVYEGESPEDPQDTLCIGLEGTNADVVQEALDAALERLDLKALKLFEGGPEVRERFAVVRDGVWCDPGRK